MGLGQPEMPKVPIDEIYAGNLETKASGYVLLLSNNGETWFGFWLTGAKTLALAELIGSVVLKKLNFNIILEH